MTGLIRGLLARFVAVVAFLAMTLSGAVPASPAGAQEPADPLSADSLAALSQLVTPENCTKKDAADGDIENGITLLYVFCDDGVPPAGGGEAGIPVPVKYHANEAGNDWAGLPLPAPVEEVAEAAEDDLRPERDNRITLDVDISLPPSGASVLFPEEQPVGVPASGQPVIVFMHGCCGGNKTSWEASSIDGTNELWHHSNAWFAANGYVVINYTARGFRDANDRGSTGTTQLDSRRYEINDYQYLVGLLADHDAMQRDSGVAPVFSIDPKKVGAVGGSYGGGFSWMAITDPTWRAPVSRTRIRLAAAVPKYGWTDLVEALVPSGHYFDKNAAGKTRIAPTDPKKALSRDPIGVEKQSIVSGLYATGNLATGNHTTFPDYVHDVFARLQQGEPYDGDPNIERIADMFLNDRSAYFQSKFWKRVGRGFKVPIYAPATWTDPLFPTIESVRFYNKLKKLNPRYPIGMYLGDYQHFVQNKPKEWGDLCGNDHHVCTADDHTILPGFFGDPPFIAAITRERRGISSRIDQFLDHFLYRRGKRPALKVSSTTTICAANATEKYKADEPGIEYRAGTWRALTGGKPQRFGWAGGGAATITTTSAALDRHAEESDPVVRDRQTNKCFSTAQTNPGPGVVQLVSEELKSSFTMMGLPVVDSTLETSATNYWIAARLFDQAPDGGMTMVTRGVCRADLTVSEKEDCSAFSLFGNAWRFKKGHQLVLELSQSDTPFLRRNNVPSTIAFPEVDLTVPTVPAKRKVDFRG